MSANGHLNRMNQEENDYSEFVEVDPTGRYGRYNDILGKGASKIVYRGFDEYEGIEVAWNQVKLYDFLQSSDDLERLYSEIHLLKTLKHRNIMKFFASWVDTSKMNINFVTELFTSGTLKQYREKHRRVNIRAVKNWCRQILKGLLYLHGLHPPVIHRDLKCDNIFINGNQGEVKIGDLGLAAILRKSHAEHCVGTPEFMAPEVYEEEYNELVDIYSFGMCVLEMVTFEYPYSECTHPAQIYMKVVSGTKPEAMYRVRDPAMRRFVEKCLADASTRLSAKELLKDPFLRIDGDDDAGEMGIIFRQPSLHLFSANGGFSSDLQHLTEAENSWDCVDISIHGINLFGSHVDETVDNIDITIQGRRKEDGGIFLRLRISDKDGRVRNIYFPFDIETDTALSVATEMVAELDITEYELSICNLKRKKSPTQDQKNSSFFDLRSFYFPFHRFIVIMLQRFVDNAIGVAKESVKTFTYESLNNIARLINGVSALLLAVLPGKTTILEGIQGWELRPTFRGPRLPRWMENGVSSFNSFIHELSVDSDSSTSGDYISVEEDNEEDMLPASPLSQTSRFSRASSFRRYDRCVLRLIKYVISGIIWTTTLFLWIPIAMCQFVGFKRSETRSNHSSSSDQLLCPHATKKSPHIKDHIVLHNTDRRRGVIEDLHLAIEIFIEAIFDMVHKAAHFLLSPSEIFRKIFGWISNNGRNGKDDSDSDPNVAVPTATLGDTDPTPTERETTFHHSLNTDARTCQDVITELGYPYEAIRVVTSDGYVLLLERIPRRDSQKVVYLQHGILDSSMGWVSNGVVGSPAFAAYDQGYDVFLGNLRGLVSREHVVKNISSRKYWRYSINEHGTQDVPAMIEKIHEIKTSELKKTSCRLNSEEEEEKERNQPYKLCVICHSLGGAIMLMYVITRRLAEKPHRLSRMVLLSPAGFHEDSSLLFTLVERLILLFGPILAPIVPGLYIPTRFFRMLLNKLARDFQNYPALGGLVQTLMSYVVGGDSSNWIGVLGLPHYNMYDMPGVSLHVAIHLAQIKKARRFIMYNYGSAAANMEAYGSPKPLDLGEHYDLIDIPIDLVAGRKDKVIRPAMVRKHYRMMKRAGVEVSYNEFEYAHLDFTFSHREELLSYVMSRLLLVEPPQKHSVVRYRKTNKIPRENDTNEITPM